MTDLRDDVALFARRVLGLKLWPHQVAALESGAFITVVAKARRTGGTVLCEVAAIHTAFASAGCRAIVLSATQDAARRITESIGVRLASSKLTKGAVVDAHAARVRLTNGSEIISLPASQRQVRGYGAGVRLVILDEASFMPAELWRAAHYTALDERRNGSRILMVGTPWAGAEHFFRQAFIAGRDGDPDHQSFHWRAAVNPLLDKAYLERMRERISPVEYASEICGEWSDAGGSLIPTADLDANTADFETQTLARLHGPARVLLGVDWGVSFDRSSAVAIARLPISSLNPNRPPRPTFAVVVAEIWPAGTPLTNVVAEVVSSPADFAVISPETSGVGAGPTQELMRRMDERRRELRAFAERSGEPRPPALSWNEVHTSAAKKTIAYGWIRHLLEERRLVLPRHPDLLRQLRGLRFEIGERGFMRIEAEARATHDDCADALMLAAAPYTQPKGRTTCLLAELAASADPDAEVPPSEDTVTTGAGLVIPRRPDLQSVSGLDVTRAERPVIASGVERLLAQIRDHHDRRERDD